VIRQAQSIFGTDLEPLTDTAEGSLDETQGFTQKADDVPSELKAIMNPSQSPEEIGRLGNCRILGFIGRGGMGAVFRGEDLSLARPVAIKVLYSGRPVDASMRQRFIREAKAMAAIDHENVVSIFSVDEKADPPFLTMPLLSGEVMSQRMAIGERFTSCEVARIGKEVAAALEAAHQRGVIHRDVKPGNIWLEPSGRIKLLDFGLAHAGDMDLTSTGQVLGTPRYMAPEQTFGRPAEERSDLFSLGCVLYQLATGSPPFDGDSLAAVFRNIGDGNYDHLDSSNAAIDAELAQVVTKLLEVDPSDRYSSATELRETLAAIELGLTTSGESGNRAIPTIAPSPEPKRSASRRPPWAVVAVILLGMGGLGFGVLSWVLNSGSLSGLQDAPISQRELAQWVIDIGGFVSLQNGNLEIRDSEQLPTPIGAIHSVYLSRIEGITDGDLEMLVHLNEGSGVYLQGLEIDGSGLEYIAKIAQLDGVNLDDCKKIDPSNLRYLRDQPAISYLSASGTRLGDELIELATALPRLSALALGENATAEGFRLIGKCSELTELNLVSCLNLDSEALAPLKDFENLHQLTFHSGQLNRGLVSQLTRCPHVKKVRFYFGEPSMETLGELQHVEMLDLSYNDLKNVEMEALGRLASLKELILRDCNLSSETQRTLMERLPNCRISI
ncbi:MAG: protein kinase, partial [Planctomycetota bacterium]